MKISIGSRLVDGPWGGGNLFVRNLTRILNQNGHEVVYNLEHNDIDGILLTDPRGRQESLSSFNHMDIERYIDLVNPNAIVVQRINECDERKGTKGINNLYLEASEIANKVVFVSEWLRSIYLEKGMDKEKTSVILAGADRKIFNNENTNYRIDKSKKIKLVTHHWSDNWNKGFDIYKRIDDSINKNYFEYDLEFSYIGNISNKINFKNTKVIKPLAGKELADELKTNHIYVTGSLNEPSGNHHIEAAQCGLPILYRNSGGIPEYCDGYGLDFENDFFEKLRILIENYEMYIEKVQSYPNDADEMSMKFLSIFENNFIKQETISISKDNDLKYYKFKFNYKIKEFLQMSKAIKGLRIIIAKFLKER